MRRGIGLMAVVYPRPYSVAQRRAKVELRTALQTQDPVAQLRRLERAVGAEVFKDAEWKGAAPLRRNASQVLSDLRHSVGASTEVCEIDPETRGRAALDANQSYDWLRKANDEPDREARRQISALTRKAVACHGYKLGDSIVPLECVEKMMKGTRLVYPASSSWPLSTETGKPLASWSRSTKVCVNKGVVLDVALERCKAGHRTVAVNAASSYHAGGGFLTGGRHALEEAICIQSTLYASLDKALKLAEKAGVATVTWARPERNRNGNDWHAHIPDDGAILSPCVEVFRQGTFSGYAFETKAVALAGIVSVAMPNCNDRMSDSPVDAHPDPQEYSAQLDRKWRATLAAAAFFTDANCLVVPDAGCGVFRNPPEQVGASFGRVLRNEFAGRFDEVVIAFPGGKAGEQFAEAVVAAYEAAS